MEKLLNKIDKLSAVSPILVEGMTKEDFKNAEILPASIPSKDLGIVNTSKGLKAPKWFAHVMKSDINTIIIDGIDGIDMENQEKFYELLKYKTISSIEFYKEIKIVVLYKDLKKVSPNIISLCQIIK